MFNPSNFWGSLHKGWGVERATGVFPTRSGEPCKVAVVTSSPPIEGEGWRSWGGVIKYEIFQRPNSFTAKCPI